MDMDKTSLFKVIDTDVIETKEIIQEVYDALEERGYNPTNQIVGYLMSGDPGYISSHKEARNKITEFDRTKILEILVEDFLNNR